MVELKSLKTNNVLAYPQVTRQITGSLLYTIIKIVLNNDENTKYENNGWGTEKGPYFNVYFKITKYTNILIFQVVKDISKSQQT